jgi:hypothetical protein
VVEALLDAGAKAPNGDVAASEPVIKIMRVRRA